MCHNLDGQKFQQLMDFKKNKNKKECYINPVSTAVTFILFLFLKKCESTKNAKCIWICYEIVLRNVLQKSLKKIFIWSTILLAGGEIWW